jgi:hypothetical protein
VALHTQSLAALPIALNDLCHFVAGRAVYRCDDDEAF